jgi:hypothetical protein
VRISRRVGGLPTRDRYHVDVVFVGGQFLFLIELKCRLSEGAADIIKLQDIKASYTLEELLNLIVRRATVPLDLSSVQHLVLGLGFEVFDRPSIPSEFIAFNTGTTPPGVVIGAAVPSPVVTLFT